jgi:hypothetical protein
MGVPITHVVQPFRETLFNFLLLSSPIRPKAEAASEITAARTGRLLDRPGVIPNPAEELTARLPAPE